MINQIVKKRTDLINFFFKEDKTYTKEDIFNKEFAVLSFSPTEEYIDILKTPYDDIFVDLSNFIITDMSEMYLKGIIVDVDRQNFQTIIHVQNKENIVSITCSGATLNKYDQYCVVGEPIIAKCKIYNERLYLSFLIQLNDSLNFDHEWNYISGESKEKIDIIMSNRKKEETHYGLIVECNLVKTKKGKDMVIGTLYDGEQYRSFGTVKTQYNLSIPEYAIAGDYVKFNKPNDNFFINNMEVVSL